MKKKDIRDFLKKLMENDDLIIIYQENVNGGFILQVEVDELKKEYCDCEDKSE